MDKLTFLIWSSAAYIFLALMTQILFFRKWSGKFFGKYESTISLFRKPIVFAVWVLVFFSVLEQTLAYFDYKNADHALSSIKNCLLLIAFAFGVQAYKSHFLKIYAKKNPLNQDVSVINGIDKLLTVAIVVITLLLILDTLGFQSGPLLAFGGVGAAALGFAAKDVISNFFGGFMLVISRPFNLGDLVLIPDKKIEANVIQVGWYMTTLKDKAKRFIYLPNSTFVNTYIINSSRRTHRKIESSLMVKAVDKQKAMLGLNQVRKILENYPGLDHNLNPYASIESCEYGVFLIRISAYTEIKDEKQFYAFQEKLLLTLCEGLELSGLKLHTAEHVLANTDN